MMAPEDMAAAVAVADTAVVTAAGVAAGIATDRDRAVTV
jgi:hypothetical protein